MRKITSFILALALTLSLLVIAGAADQADVHLLVKPDTSSINGNTMKFLVYLELKEGVEVGAAKFKLTAPEGTTFTHVDMNPKYAYDSSRSTDPTYGQGWKKGAFDLSAITSLGSGDIGGGIKDSGQTFEAVLAGTVYKDITVTLNGASVTYEKHMLDKAKCDSYGWLYQLTVTKNSGTDGGSYTVGIPTVVNEKSDDFSAGYDTNDPSSPNVSVRHSVSATSTPYTPASPTGVTVSGKIKSYNPSNQVTIRLLQGAGDEKYKTTIAASTGSRQVTQDFSIADVAPGTYDLEVTKAAHLKYTIKNVVVPSSDLDLTTLTGKPYQTITLIAGNMNTDNAVNNSDLLIFRSQFGKSGANITNGNADINGDKKVNNGDLLIFRSSFGKTTANSTFNYDVN